MSVFHEIQFPISVSYGSTSGRRRRTQIVELASGAEERNTNWKNSRRQFDVGSLLRDLNKIDLVIEFWESLEGPLDGFRYRDPMDYKSCKPSEVPANTDQALAIGDGVEKNFQLTKTRTTAAGSWISNIVKPVTGTVLLAVDGVAQISGADYSVNTITGVVVFTLPPGSGLPVTAGFEYDVPVRFRDEELNLALHRHNVGNIPSIFIVEVRV